MTDADIADIKAAARARVGELVQSFRRNEADYLRAAYNETQARTDFITPLLAAFGWDVHNTADGVRYASSTIESVVGGCAISEFYDSPKAPGGAYAGKSYSSFDPKDGLWHQFYVDMQGNATWYTGSLTDDGALTMTAKGAKALQEMSYIPQADGTVRQIGRFSADEGKTWVTGYDYTYRRRAE